MENKFNLSEFSEKILDRVQKKYKNNYSLEYYKHMNQMVKMAIKLTIKEIRKMEKQENNELTKEDIIGCKAFQLGQV